MVEWYGFSDSELERQITDRMSFRKFLDFLTTIPDFSTIWTFRDILSKTGKDKEIW
ncbi:MAG: transposase [Methanosarcinaceae archaeon]|nr:transposase [Methanosarcinaceae archaeon]